MSVTPEVEVAVALPESEPDNVDVTVINEIPDETPATDAVEAVVIETEITHESRITALEIAVASLIPAVVEAEAEAEYAADIAETALEEAVETAVDIDAVEPVVTELAEESVEEEDSGGLFSTDDEVKPDSAKRHWLFRSRDEWRK